MAAIPWSEFSKEELVEILNELGRCNCTVEELWSECNVYYATDCRCPPHEHSLPSRVLEIRDRVVRRTRSPRIPIYSPLRKLLRSPFHRRA